MHCGKIHNFCFQPGGAFYQLAAEGAQGHCSHGSLKLIGVEVLIAPQTNPYGIYG